MTDHILALPRTPAHRPIRLVPDTLVLRRERPVARPDSSVSVRAARRTPTVRAAERARDAAAAA